MSSGENSAKTNVWSQSFWRRVSRRCDVVAKNILDGLLSIQLSIRELLLIVLFVGSLFAWWGENRRSRALSRALSIEQAMQNGKDQQLAWALEGSKSNLNRHDRIMNALRQAFRQIDYNIVFLDGPSGKKTGEIVIVHEGKIVVSIPPP